MIRCFSWVTRIKSKGGRRFVMCLVALPVLLEYIVNAPIGFAIDFKQLWNVDINV